MRRVCRKMRGEAPRPARAVYPLGIAATLAAVVVLAVALAGRGPDASLRGAIAGASSSGPSAAATATVPEATPSPSGSRSPSQVSGSSITCSADQLVLGKSRSGYEFSTFYKKVVFVTQTLRNAGGECVLDEPKKIRVASASGPFQSVTVVNAGTASSFKIRSGQDLSIVLGDSWPDPPTYAGAGMTPPPCADAISDVTRAEFPLGTGSLQIDWDTVWHQVCSAQKSVSVTIKN